MTSIQTASRNNSIIPNSPECSIIVDDVEKGRLEIEINVLPESVSPEQVTNRIKEFQRVAEGRKIEFARLLEEHAQVIRRLKQMEDSESTTTVSNSSIIPSTSP